MKIQTDQITPVTPTGKAQGSGTVSGTSFSDILAREVGSADLDLLHAWLDIDLQERAP